MDPVAHTLFGATLAEAGLKKKTAMATATLIIGANLPDIDAIAMVWGSDYALLVRRGWSHGILAMILLPFLLTGFMLLYDLLWYRRRSRFGSRLGRSRGDGGIPPPMKPSYLLLISCVAVWSHPLLDLLNTYGVRLLMPFSEQWFYGDILFIVDPWIWLLMGAAVVLARSDTIPGIAGWVVVGSATTALVTGTGVVPFSAKVLWCTGVLIIILIRWQRWMRGRIQYVAAVCLILSGLYLVLMFTGSRMTVWHAKEHLSSLNIEVQSVMADPQPARVFNRGGIAVSDTHYYLFRLNWADRGSFELRNEPIPIEEPGPVIQAALRTPLVEGFRNWIRFPHYEVARQDDGWRVIIRDLRYVAPDQYEVTGIGIAVVELDEDLEPK